MATEKRKIHRVINDAGDLVQVLPETSAEQVTLADASGKFASSNVEDALQELATGISGAGKVDDVRNNASDASTSIVTNKVADLSKAVVKEAGKVTNNLTFATKEESASIYHRKCTYDGSVETVVGFQKGDLAIVEIVEPDNGGSPKNIAIGLPSTGVTAGTYQGLTVDAKGRVTAAEDKGYAVKANVDTELAKKLDKAGGSVTGNLTIGGNLTVNGTTTTVDSTTLQVKDKLIEVAHGNTTKLTTPAGLVAPKYDGTNSGALVFNGDGIASVGDVVLDASGNIDVTRSQLQPLATRTGLVNDNLVKYDSANQTLVDSGKKTSDFATAAQGSNADSALSKANANATEIANIKNGTTKVKSAEHADTATNATNVTTNINGHAITDIFEADGVTVKSASEAKSANRVKHQLQFEGKHGKALVTSVYNGEHLAFARFDGTRFECTADINQDGNEIFTVDLKDILTNVNPTAQYSAVKVDAKGRVTAVGKSIEWGTSGQTTPSADLMTGGLFMELQ